MNPRHALPLLVGLVGCGGTKTPGAVAQPSEPAVDPGPPSEPPATIDTNGFYANQAAVQQSLERLDALDLIDLGALVVDAPMGSQNCYGPCADDPVDQAWLQEHAHQAARLAALVDLAESIAAEVVEPVEDGDDAASIAALQGLQIVEVAGMAYTTDGSCYVGFCPGDGEKRAHVRALADAAQGL